MSQQFFHQNHQLASSSSSSPLSLSPSISALNNNNSSNDDHAYRSTLPTLSHQTTNMTTTTTPTSSLSSSASLSSTANMNNNNNNNSSHSHSQHHHPHPHHHDHDTDFDTDTMSMMSSHQRQSSSLQQQQQQQHSNKLQIGGPLNAMSASPDGSLIAVGGRTVYRIVKLNSENHTFQLHIPIRVAKKGMNYGVVDLKWHPMQSCSNLIATAPTNGKVILWNIHSSHSVRLERQFEEHKRTVNSICWRPLEENNLLSGSQDGTVKMWDIRSPKSAISFQCNGEVRCVKFSPRYKNIFAAGLESGDTQIWDIRKPERCSRNLPGHNGLVLTLDWHPSLESMIATGGRDRMIRIWNLQEFSNRPVSTVQTIASVASVLWRPQYRNQLISCANMVDAAAHLWSLNNRYVPLLTFKGHDEVITGMLWNQDSPDRLITCSKDGNILIQSLSDAIYPKADLQTTALAWNVHNDLACISDKIDRKQHEQYCKIVQQNNGVEPVPPFQYTESKIRGDIQVFEDVKTDVAPAGLDSAAITTFAEQYQLFHGTIKEKCEKNARVAASIGKLHIEKVWKFLLAAYADVDTHNQAKKKENGRVNDHSPHVTYDDEHTYHHSDSLDDSATEDDEDDQVDEEDDDMDPSASNAIGIYSFPGYFEQTPPDSFMPPSVPFNISGLSPPTMPVNNGGGSMHLMGRESSTFESIFSSPISSHLIQGTPSSPVQSHSNSVQSSLETAASSFKSMLEAADMEKVKKRLPQSEYMQDIMHSSSSKVQLRNLPSAPVFHFVSNSKIEKTNGIEAKSRTMSAIEAMEADINDIRAHETNEFDASTKDSSQFNFEEVVNSLLDFYSEQGDPQTCVAIVAVLGDKTKQSKQRVYEWYLSYIELLNRLQLFTFANEVINGSPETFINNMNRQSTSVRTSCGKCGTVLQKGTICENCKSKTNTCAICHLPVFGVFFWCQKCGHGGHLDHMINWFKKYGHCPVCGTKADSVQKMN